MMRATDKIHPETDFTEFFAENGKPASEWAIGAEIEVFGFTRDTLERISPAQVQAVIASLAGRVIGTKSESGFVTEAILDEGRLTLEPGGQIEFSISPKRSLREIETILESYFSTLKAAGERLDILFVATGFDPLRSIEEQRWIPKQRYEIMRPYLAKRGRRAWDMMCRTSAMQVNFDYSDLEDLARKFTLANRLAPVAAAMFANSPFAEGKLSGYKSTRYAAWLETDAHRTGAAPGVLDGHFSIERFVEYVKSVPMFFIRRDEQYINLAGFDFRKYLAEGYEGQTPILQDFTDHLSTIFTEARLKPYIEQRSMDCGQIGDAMMAMAFWKGLLYDRKALEKALQIVPRVTDEEYAALRGEVARYGLDAKYKTISVYELAKAAIDIAKSGLQRIAPEENDYLEALEETAAIERRCPADDLIGYRDQYGIRYHRWHGDIRRTMESMEIRD
jgi:glutamate--cysteine ligase